MSGPWDKYKDQAPAATDGPWNKYKDPSDLSGLSGSVVTKQEMPEDVSLLDRAKLKNFANSPESMVKYLQDKYPQYEVFHDKNQILFKKPGDTQMQVLDPKGWQGFGELGKDLLDIPYDVGSGIASTAAGSAAAGIGGLPAAMGAAGATGAGLETLRQGIGKALDIPQDINGGDVALQGAMSSANPLLFGTGVAKAAGPSIQESGLAGRGWDAVKQKFLPWLGEKASGIPAGTIRSAAQNMPAIKQMEQNGVMDLVTNTHEALKSSLQQAKSAKGQELQAALESANQPVDISKIKDGLKNYLSGLRDQAKKLPNGAARDELSAAEENINNIILQGSEPASSVLGPSGKPISMGGPREIPDAVDAKTAFKLQDQLKDLADLGKTGEGMLARNSNKPVSVKGLQNNARDAYSQMNDALEEATGGISQELKDQYKSYAQIQKTLAPYFKTPDQTYNTLRNLGGKNKQVLLERLKGLDDQLGTDMVSKAKLIDAYSSFADKSAGPTGLVTDAIKQRLPAASLGFAAGYGGSNEMGGGRGQNLAAGIAGGAGASLLSGPSAMRQYFNLQDLGTAAAPSLRGLPLSIWNMIQTNKEQNQEQQP